jgi:sugar/nucleoside kinase (ribokinase family)
MLAVELGRADGVIIEDYGKGAVTQAVADLVLAIARRRGIPVGLDPKDGHELELQGITVATPNRKEALAIAGMADPGLKEDPLADKALRKAGEILMEKWAAQNLAITLGPHGMFLLTRGKPPRHVPTRAREVYDVSGAGDTVIAACVTALAAGRQFPRSRGAGEFRGRGGGGQAGHGLLHARGAVEFHAEAAEMKGRVIGVIPSRWGSTRFPGKSLAPIGGKPLLVRVVERARLARRLDGICVATDDERIAAAARACGAAVAMTRP